MKLVITLVLVAAILLVICPAEEDPWGYHLSSHFNFLHKVYNTHEMEPHTAFMCPAGYFIFALSYRFQFPQGFSGTEEEQKQLRNSAGIGDNSVELHIKAAFSLWEKSKGKSHVKQKGNIHFEYDSDFQRNMTNDQTKHGPCPTLMYCVGYQACLFRFSIELCRNDPIPGYRKFLEVRLTCGKQQFWDEVKSEWGSSVAKLKWPEQTVHLKYKSSLEKGIMDLYQYTDITQVKHRKKEVFEMGCSDSKTAYIQGYRGNCSNEPSGKPLQTEALWKNLGRTLTHECSSQLVEVYCAYQYNASGHCSPPFLLHKQSERKFNSVTMPQNRNWPDPSIYNQIYSHPNMKLIPARIGFAILVHAAPEVLVDLLRLIYRPYHYYAIHIDGGADETRAALYKLLKENFKTATNIRIIPKERSSRASWGGFGITRAELEALEELMRMGLWDFAYIMSGSDVPLRDVDDFAASLAPYRGKSFMGINSKINSTDRHVTAAWHNCDSHVFRVGPRSVPSNVDIYSHSAFVLLARSAVELLVSADRPAHVNDMHFLLTSMFIADESYIGSALFSTEHKDSIVSRMFHFLRHFEPHNVVNLCRHSDTTDACGQGPGDFTPDDLGPMRLHAHHFFFARKFKMDLEDQTRAEMVGNYHDNAYKNSMSIFFPKDLISKLASSTLSYFPSGRQIESMGDISNWRIVTSLTHSDPCCHIVAERRSLLTDEFKLWMDYQVVDKKGQTHNATATFIPANTYKCYPGGSIRMLHVSTRADLKDPSSKPSEVNIPVPSLPTGAAAFWLQIHFDLSEIKTPCARLRHKQNPDKRMYITFPSEAEVRQRKHVIVTDVTVTDTTGVIRCSEQLPLELGPEQIEHHGSALWFRHPLKCPNITDGIWTITLKDRIHPHPFVYSVTVNVVNETTPEVYEEQAVKLAEYLWSVSDVMINDDDVERFYKTPDSGNGQGKSQQNDVVSKTTVHRKYPDVKEYKELITDHFQQAIKFVVECHDCILIILLSVVTTAALYYLFSSWISSKRRRRSKLGLTKRIVIILIGFTAIHQMLLYVQLDLRFIAVNG